MNQIQIPTAILIEDNSLKKNLTPSEEFNSFFDKHFNYLKKFFDIEENYTHKNIPFNIENYIIPTLDIKFPSITCNGEEFGKIKTSSHLYIGELINGNKHGKGIFYYDNNNIIMCFDIYTYIKISNKYIYLFSNEQILIKYCDGDIFKGIYDRSTPITGILYIKNILYKGKFYFNNICALETSHENKIDADFTTFKFKGDFIEDDTIMKDIEIYSKNTKNIFSCIVM